MYTTAPSVQRPPLTVRQYCEASSLSERHVRRLIAEGRIPAFRLTGGRAIRIPATALDELFAEAVAR